MTKQIKRILALTLIGLFLHSSLHAEVSVGASMFSKGKSRGTIYGSSASSFDENYFVLGLGYGYYVLNGLQLGVDAESWLGASPSVYKVTPQILYVLARGGRIFPYVGGFYRRTYIEDLPDMNSYGGRAGVYSMMGRNVYAGVGIVYEQYSDCQESIYTSCSSTYPELNISVGF